MATVLSETTDRSLLTSMIEVIYDRPPVITCLAKYMDRKVITDNRDYRFIYLSDISDVTDVSVVPVENINP